MTNIKLRIEGDRILTDTGVEVGELCSLTDAPDDDTKAMKIWALPGYYHDQQLATDDYNAHLREVLGDRVVVPREPTEAQIDASIPVLGGGHINRSVVADVYRAMLKEADHD